MYKCIQTEFGVDISINSTVFISFNSLTHLCTNLGNGNVRIERKIDNLKEIVSTPISNFTTLAGVPIATTYEGLNAYFTAKSGAPKAGEGVSIADGVVSVIAGGPATIGGYRVGNGLMVDGTGRLSATAVSEVTKVLSTEAEMLGQSTEALRPYRVIRLDTKRLYYLNAGESPAVLSNWFVGPSIEAAVVSFKARTGVVVPEFGDYNADQVPLIDKTTSVNHKLVIDGGKLYVENIQTSVRQEVTMGGDVSGLQTQITALNDTVNGPATGLVKQVGDLKTEQARLTNVVSNVTTGLEARVQLIETTPKANLVNGKVPYEELPALGMSDAQVQRLAAVEASASLANQKGDIAATNSTLLSERITEVEIRTSVSNIPSSQKGAMSGVAPLDSLAKVPIVNLPTFLPQRVRTWRDVLSTRTYNSWTLNNSGNDMTLHIRTNQLPGVNDQILVYMRAQGETGNGLDFRSGTIGVGADRRFQLTQVVPAGWQYAVQVTIGTGGGSIANIEKWYELS